MKTSQVPTAAQTTNRQKFSKAVSVLSSSDEDPKQNYSASSEAEQHNQYVKR